MAPRSCLQMLFGGTFALIVIFFLCLAYYLYAVKVYFPLSRCTLHTVDPTAKVILIGFHLLLGMQVWSLMQTMGTDPGVVPPYWGFYVGDAEVKRKRYCLMCHVFKPERCHHCSICNRCVLNMDHHCRKSYAAWVNNCIGFCNRKYFILLLMYTILTLYYVDVTLFPLTYAYVVSLSVLPTQANPVLDVDKLVIVSFFVFTSLLSVILTAFCRFHIHLVLTNSTTIENLEMEEGKEVSKFTIGVNGNWMQVFGRNPWLWPLPIVGKSGKPLGDGVSWLQPNPTPILDDYVPDSVRNSVESPRPSTAVHHTMSAIKEQVSDVQPENTEEQNHTSQIVVNLKVDKGRPSDVETDSSFLTSVALVRGSSMQPDDSYLREMSAKVESPSPSPMLSPEGILEISLRDPHLFHREMSE